MTPSLFDLDKVDWHTGKDLTGMLQKLYAIKKLPILLEGDYLLEADEAQQTIVGRYETPSATLVGVFCTHSRPMLPLKLDALGVPDGSYTDLLFEEPLTVRDGVLLTDGRPHIFLAKKGAAQ